MTATYTGAYAGAQLGDVCVLGLGKTGRDVALYLAALAQLDNPRVASVTLYGGAKSAEGPTVDELRAHGVRVVTGTEEVAGSYDLTVASPGIPEDSAFMRAAMAASREVVSEPEFAWRESPERWVAITGTNGKTTTTTLATALLRAGGLDAEAVGNIGTLVTGELKGRRGQEWFVAELSSFQLALASYLHPRVACLLNITPDHLSWHGSMEAYAAAKERAFARLDADGARDLAVISVDDHWCADIAERVAARGVRTCLLSVEREPEGPCAAFLRQGELVVRLDGVEHLLGTAADLPLKGAHNAQNMLAASMLALDLGVADADVIRCLAGFAPLEHRIEPCGTIGGVALVNDSKATNVDSTLKALTSFEAGRLVCLLGGHDKGTDLAELATLATACCRGVVCFGAAGERIAEAVEPAAAGTSCAVVRAPHLAEALDAGLALAQPGDTVLLSPACASFDEFSGFEERGRVFKRLVAERMAAQRSEKGEA